MNRFTTSLPQSNTVEILDLQDLFVLTRQNLDQLIQNVSLSVDDVFRDDRPVMVKICGCGG